MNIHTLGHWLEIHGSFGKRKCVKSATRGSVYFPPVIETLTLAKTTGRKKYLTEQSAFSSLYQKDFMKENWQHHNRPFVVCLNRPSVHETQLWTAFRLKSSPNFIKKKKRKSGSSKVKGNGMEVAMIPHTIQTVHAEQKTYSFHPTLLFWISLNLLQNKVWDEENFACGI